MSDSPRFHPLVEGWFAEALGEPTATQAEGWRRIAAGRDTLVAAPTGSGKTFAAFLWAIDELVRQAEADALGDETSVVYVSPLKALGNDIQKNLREPLDAIRDRAAEQGLELPDIRVLVRSGDTPQSERAQMIKRPPHILVTTPESLFIMLTAERSRGFLGSVRTVIVDEIHAVAGDKRGAHLALSLERLDRLAGQPLQRIGLSATQKPIAEVARLLVGNGRLRDDGSPDCEIVDAGHRREWDLSVEIPDAPLGPIATHELRAEMYDRIAELAKQHRTTLVFVDTRRLAERVTHALEERLGQEHVAPHHGSLSREIRLRAEQGLKEGSLRVVVATASLELGIDIGHVDLVCHVGAPRSIATLLQRIGRSGHFLGGTPRGAIFPLTRDELTQTAAAIRAARAGELDRVIFPREPLDVLAQQIVAIAAAEEVREEDVYALVRRAFHYKDLSREDFDEIVEMLSEGVAGRHGRRSAHLHRDRVNGVLKGRRGARLAAITSGGAIPDIGDYDVVEEPAGTFVGTVNEDFAIESMAGDIFLLGNTSWRIRRVEAGKVRVENAHGLPPTIPFWVGEAPGRTEELSTAVSDLRAEVASRLEDPEAAVRWLVEETEVPEAGAQQIVEHLAEGVALLGAIPTKDTVVAERFFDESGGMQLIIHAPFGARINRAWGLALRKKFCVQFDFELQAAATDDAILLSLGEQHSFPLESVAGYLKPLTLRNTLIQAMLPSPMFANRWRWNATRALALLRHSGGRKVPVPIQRMRAEDLLSAVFPEQVMCQDNRMGDVVPPDHPIVNETVKDCLHEAMDLDGLAEIVERIGSGEIRFVAAETPAPSVFSHEVLNAGPFAFLDDAPLE
ncbi:MAG TPA: DEAD/DEAH box helicase, partial [Actinomycetota bacterium]